MAEQFDVVVIGGGPAGYVAAIRAAQLGLNTACVDMYTGKDGKPAPGGTCLNIGCIPSKALLDSSKHFHHIRHQYQDHGISVDNPVMDVAAMIARKDKIVKQLTGGVQQLFKGNKVSYFNAKATLHKDKTVSLAATGGGDEVILQAGQVILAPGSVPVEIPAVAYDNKYIVDNAGALAFETVPKRLGVIGAGIIGLELGSVWGRLGSAVTLLEALPDFLPACDVDIARQAAREFSKQGLKVHLGTMVISATVVKKEVLVIIEGEQGEQQMTFDKLLVSVGRKAYTEGLLAEGAGVNLTGSGQIEVDRHNRTAVEGVWAIGDAVRGPMLAHKGSDEGIAVAELIAGLPGHVNLDMVPWVVYTDPEIAWVGKTEAELQAAGIDYSTGSFPFAATGRGLAMGNPVGMVKILADKMTDELLGCHILGASASELIAECVVAMEFNGSAEDLARICHAHPTLSEAVHEAALHVDKRAIHKAN